MSPDVALGLAKIAHAAGRDLQRAARDAGGPDELWAMAPGRLVRHLRLTGDPRDEVIHARRSFDAVGERENLHARGIGFVERETFPDRLLEIYDPPFGLFVRSEAPDGIGYEEGQPVVAVVGARKATAAGSEFARRLSSEIAQRGGLVISGLAHGIDAAAHRGALDGGGRTQAVLGCGVDVSYPRRNQTLAGKIVESGALVSEYWPGTTPAPWHFPARNRIVSGLAHATVVIEAAERSGALITADFAAEHGRQVLAVPGAPWAELAAGANALLRAGAAMCESAEDVVAELPGFAWRDISAAKSLQASPRAAELLAAVRVEALSADDLSARLDISLPQTLQLVAELELAGVLVREGNQFCAVG